MKQILCKCLMLLSLVLSAGAVFAGEHTDQKVAYKVEWPDGQVMEVVVFPGDPLDAQELTDGGKFTCNFQKPGFIESSLSIRQYAGRTVKLVADSIDGAGVKTFMLLEFSKKSDNGTEQLSSGNCIIPTGSASTVSVVTVDSMPWGKKMLYKFPDGSVVSVTARKL